MDKRPQHEAGIYQNPRGEHSSNLFDITHSNFFQDMSPKAKETKAKMSFWDFIKIKKFLHSKGNSQQNKEAPKGMEEDIPK